MGRATTIEELQEQSIQQADDLVQLAHDLTTVRRDHDTLEGKLRYPGTKFLVDLEYRLIYNNPSLSIPANYTGSLLLETLPGKLHAFYILSAYPITNTTAILVTDGPVLSPSSPFTGGVSLAIDRQLRTGPARILIGLRMTNTDLTIPITIAVQVWRRLGLGAAS